MSLICYLVFDCEVVLFFFMVSNKPSGYNFNSILVEGLLKG